MMKYVLIAPVLSVVVIGAVVIMTPKSEQPKLIGQSQHLLEAKIVSKEGAKLYGDLAEGCRNADSEIVLEVSEEGVIQINKHVVEKSRLGAFLKEVYYQRNCKIMFISADPRLSWGDIVYIVDAGRGAGALSLIMTDELKRELGYPPRTP